MSSCPKDGFWPVSCCHGPVWPKALSMPGAEEPLRSRGAGWQAAVPLRGIQGISWKGEVSHGVWLPGLAQDTAMPTLPALSLQLSFTELTPDVHPAGIIPSSCRSKQQALIKSKGSSRRCSKTMQCPPREGHWGFTIYSHFSTFRAFFVLG